MNLAIFILLMQVPLLIFVKDPVQRATSVAIAAYWIAFLVQAPVVLQGLLVVAIIVLLFMQLFIKAIDRWDP